MLQASEESDDNVTFAIKFMSTMTDRESSVEFQATIMGETLGNTYQVDISYRTMTCTYG